MHPIKIANTGEDIANVRALFMQYLDLLNTDYNNNIGCASGLEDLDNFPSAYLALFLALRDGAPIAACGLKRINASDCELSKLYCQPQGRGHGYGRTLTQKTITHARDLGCKRLVLSTEPVMAAAVNLYKDMGFLPIENYAPKQSGCSKFMGLVL